MVAVVTVLVLYGAVCAGSSEWCICLVFWWREMDIAGERDMWTKDLELWCHKKKGQIVVNMFLIESFICIFQACRNVNDVA